MLFANGFIPFLTLSTLTLMNLSITHLDYPVLLDAYPTLKHEVISLQVLSMLIYAQIDSWQGIETKI